MREHLRTTITSTVMTSLIIMNEETAGGNTGWNSAWRRRYGYFSEKSETTYRRAESHNSPDHNMYEGKSLNNRNFILKCMEKYAQ